MIELSLGKMVLLALIALIVLGPEKLPGAARTVGALLRRVRSGWDNVKAEVERELEIEQIRRSAREAVASAEAAQQHVKDTLKETHDPFAEAAAMVKLKSPGQKDAASPDNAVGAQPDAVHSPASSDTAAPIIEQLPSAKPDQAAPRVQAELPLDEPSAQPQAASSHEAPSHDHDRDASHGHA